MTSDWTLSERRKRILLLERLNDWLWDFCCFMKRYGDRRSLARGLRTLLQLQRQLVEIAMFEREIETLQLRDRISHAWMEPLHARIEVMDIARRVLRSRNSEKIIRLTSARNDVRGLLVEYRRFKAEAEVALVKDGIPITATVWCTAAGGLV